MLESRGASLFKHFPSVFRAASDVGDLSGLMLPSEILDQTMVRHKFSYLHHVSSLRDCIIDPYLVSR